LREIRIFWLKLPRSTAGFFGIHYVRLHVQTHGNAQRLELSAMKFAAVRKYAMSLPEVTEQPHHHFGSFRVRGKIFVTVPPEQEYIHVFVAETQREQALAMYPEFVEKLLWGGKVVGVRVALAPALAAVTKRLISQAWQLKASKGVQGHAVGPME
jgi:hypothetical protein